MHSHMGSKNQSKVKLIDVELDGMGKESQKIQTPSYKVSSGYMYSMATNG